MSSSNHRVSLTAPFKSKWNVKEWNVLGACGVREALIGVRELSRFGDWQTRQLNDKAPLMREEGWPSRGFRMGCLNDRKPL